MLDSYCYYTLGSMDHLDESVVQEFSDDIDSLQKALKKVKKQIHKLQEAIDDEKESKLEKLLETFEKLSARFEEAKCQATVLDHYLQDDEEKSDESVEKTISEPATKKRKVTTQPTGTATALRLVSDDSIERIRAAVDGTVTKTEDTAIKELDCESCDIEDEDGMNADQTYLVGKLSPAEAEATKNVTGMVTPVDEIREREEVAFLFMKDCTLSLCGDVEELECTRKTGYFRSQEWRDVDIMNCEDEFQMAATSKHGISSVHTCPRCNLMLHLGPGEENGLQFKESEKCSFSGCAIDMKCCDDHDDYKTQQNRSDGALLLGTIMRCRNAGYLRIENFKVLLSGAISEYNESPKSTDEDKCSSLDDNISERLTYKQVSASIVVTISLPHLERESKLSCRKSGDSSDLQCMHYDEYLTTSSSGFAAFGQLLFSLVRCDWDWLELAMERLRSSNSITSSSPICNSNSIFPPKTTLEELYARIRGASLPEVASCAAMSLEDCTDNQTMHIAGDLTLPEELLQSKLAPYLRAKSLHNLRSTCRYLYSILNSVVPGMQLALFPHQVRSLHWMRRREEHHTTDDDVMNFGPNNTGVDEVIHGDVFRSVTSGGIISVAPRRRKGSFWQINSWTGVCSLDYRKQRIKTVARCRNVARGGLLCDDPGLGKTITILSLILQTFGQSTGKLQTDRERQLNVGDDQIIDAYWSEILVSHTRRDELLELTLKLRKCDREQYFQYPVKDLLAVEDWDSYTYIVRDPIW